MTAGQKGSLTALPAHGKSHCSGQAAVRESGGKERGQKGGGPQVQTNRPGLLAYGQITVIGRSLLSAGTVGIRGVVTQVGPMSQTFLSAHGGAIRGRVGRVLTALASRISSGMESRRPNRRGLASIARTSIAFMCGRVARGRRGGRGARGLV